MSEERMRDLERRLSRVERQTRINSLSSQGAFWDEREKKYVLVSYELGGYIVDSSGLIHFRKRAMDKAYYDNDGNFCYSKSVKGEWIYDY